MIIPSQISDIKDIFIDYDACKRNPTSIVQQLSELLNDPKFEAAALGDMAHLALDLTMFITPEMSVLTRLFAVAGRIFSIASDYIPDHDIAPDEFSFQVTMLGISIQLLMKSVTPVVNSYFFEPLRIRDKRAYCCLFRPVGLSWLQFKTISTSVLDWVEVNADEVILSPSFSGDICNKNEYFYWLYDGDIEVVEGDGSIVKRIQKKKGNIAYDLQHDIGLIGNTPYHHILRKKEIDNSISFKKKRKVHQDNKGNNNNIQETIKAGKTGAILLRINTPKLLALMDNDKTFIESVQLLMLSDIQKKVNSQYQLLQVDETTKTQTV